MDLEKMKRINALARELKDHGIVSDFDEAYLQAEKMIEGGLISSEAKAEDIAVQKTEVKTTMNMPMGFDALEIKNLSERIKSVENQINQVFVKINEIVTEINSIEKKKRESPIEMKHEEPKETQAHLKDQKVEPHPRTGGYKPEDVSIEKMFYFGRG